MTHWHGQVCPNKYFQADYLGNFDCQGDVYELKLLLLPSAEFFNKKPYLDIVTMVLKARACVRRPSQPDSGYACVELPSCRLVAVSNALKDKGSGFENALY